MERYEQLLKPDCIMGENEEDGSVIGNSPFTAFQLQDFLNDQQLLTTDQLTYNFSVPWLLSSPSLPMEYWNTNDTLDQFSDDIFSLYGNELNTQSDSNLVNKDGMHTASAEFHTEYEDIFASLKQFNNVNDVCTSKEISIQEQQADTSKLAFCCEYVENFDAPLTLSLSRHKRNISNGSSVTSGYLSTHSNVSLDLCFSDEEEELFPCLSQEKLTELIGQEEKLEDTPAKNDDGFKKSFLQRVVTAGRNKISKLHDKIPRKTKQGVEEKNDCQFLNDLDKDVVPDLPNISVKKSGRVRHHREVESDYRKRIRSSRFELMKILNLDGKQKSTINVVIQSATEEIKRLRSKVEQQEEEIQRLTKTTASTKQDLNDEDLHQVSNIARQSARDGAKGVTFVVLFLFCFINPIALIKGHPSAFEADHTFYHSRKLLHDQDLFTGATNHSFRSQLVRIGVSLLIFMFMLLRGNVRLKKDSKTMRCFYEQMRKAQEMINDKDYENAKNTIRLGLLIVGDTCPRTSFGRIISYLWKNCYHLLYQANIMQLLESIGRLVLPSGLLYPNEKAERRNAATLLVEAYCKLHEIGLKDASCHNLEADCYLMNAIHAAEVSTDHELLCKVYTLAAIHMREKAWFIATTLQNYFITLAEKESCLAKQDSKYVPYDWMFYGIGYKYFTEETWDLQETSLFGSKEDILTLLSHQYEEYLLTRILEHLLLPNGYKRQDEKSRDKENRQVYLSALKCFHSICPPNNIHSTCPQNNLYAWWKSLVDMTQCILAEKVYEECPEILPEDECHEVVIATHQIMCTYSSSVRFHSKKHQRDRRQRFETSILADKLRRDFSESSEVLQTMHEANMTETSKKHAQLKNLLTLLCCIMLMEAKFKFWEFDTMQDEKEILLLLGDQEIFFSLTKLYPALTAKLKYYELEIQSISGMNNVELNKISKKCFREI